MSKPIKILFTVILVVNFVYLVKIYPQEKRFVPKKFRLDDNVPYSEHKAYDGLNSTEKISYLLDLVAQDKKRFWLTSTEMTEPGLEIEVGQFRRLPSDPSEPSEPSEPSNGDDNDNKEKGVGPDGSGVKVARGLGLGLGQDESVSVVNVLRDGFNDGENWSNTPTLFYDPRFTISMYLDEIKSQLLAHNPHNLKALDHKVSVPFDWSDWVDLTLLNEELSKPMDQRLDCGWLQSKINKPTKYPNFCTNLADVSDEELDQIGLPKEYLPGFIVKTSPMNKAPHKQVMMQGKAHLLTHQAPPLSIIFLTQNGTYEAQVKGKQRIVHGDMFERFLERKNALEAQTVVVNPVAEYRELIHTVKPRPLDPVDSIVSNSRQDLNQLDLDPSWFHYQEQEVAEQIEEYEKRFQSLADSMTNELHYNTSVIKANKLSRHELSHYNSLKYANNVKIKDESTYYKLATLMKVNGNKDAGWHYEWRFFNGALTYKKEGWTGQELEIREKIILDRLLRNWFRFASTKGIVSWIAHGPLLSWYWNGMMFPYDIDIDLQMPSSELNRLARHYNQTLVVEDVEEGYGKYLIDCSTFLHHRDKAFKDNHIDARFIDIDTGTYIDITGVGRNNEPPPSEFKSYFRNKLKDKQEVELYMDRRKHWLTYEQISPLHHSMISGIPTYIPHDIMSMLNKEYEKGTKSYYYEGYYYVPMLRLWLHEKDLKPVLKGRKLTKLKQYQVIDLLQNLNDNDKVKLLENDDILSEYYLTHKYTRIHELEKAFMFDESVQYSVELGPEYHKLMSEYKMGSPLRKCLFDYEYIERVSRANEQVN